MSNSHLGHYPATPQPTAWHHGSLLSLHQDLAPDAYPGRPVAEPLLHGPSAHQDYSGWWSARSTHMMTCTPALGVREEIGNREYIRAQSKSYCFYAHTNTLYVHYENCRFSYLLSPSTSCWASVVVSLHCCLLMSKGKQKQCLLRTTYDVIYVIRLLNRCGAYPD